MRTLKIPVRITMAVAFGLLAVTPASTARSAAGTQAAFVLQGVVKDTSGNPIQAGVYVTDRQNQEVASLITAEDGTYSVSIPTTDDLVVQATPVGSTQNLITMADGYQISRFFPVTKGILPESDNEELDFTISPAAALLTTAYTADGNVWNFDQLYNFLNPPNYFGYGDMYGIFPLSDMALPMPAEASIGALRWAWPQDNERSLWKPTFGVPPNEPVFIMLLWEVPGIGTFPLRADNKGQGYTLSDGEARKINLVYEFAETEYRRTLELKTKLEAQGHTFSNSLVNVLNQATNALDQARNESDEAAQALLSYDTLRFSIQAKEQMTMEVADTDILKRKSDMKIIVQDMAGKAVPGASVNYQQKNLDFVLTYGQFGAAGQFPYPSYRAGLDIGYQSLYSIITWSQVSPQPGVFDFSAVDAAFNEYRSMGYEIVACLSWLGAGNVPAWAQGLDFADFQQQMGLFVKAAVTHYDGIVKYMNIVTEINLQTATGSRYISVAYHSDYLYGVQPDELIQLIKTAFQAGREAHASTLLGYYDISDYIYRVLNPLQTGAWPLSYSFFQAVMASGVQPDYIGVEMFPGTDNVPLDLSTVAGILQAYHDLTGLPVLVCESISYSAQTEDYGDAGLVPHVYWHDGMTQADQAAWETSFYKIAMSLPYVLGVQMFHSFPDYIDWGVGSFMNVRNGTDTLTNQFQPKQVFFAMQNLIASWKTNGSGATNASGEVAFNGMDGTYMIEVTTPDGLTQSFEGLPDQATHTIRVNVNSQQALLDLQQRLAKVQSSIDWSAQLGRQLDYSLLRSKLAAARSAAASHDYANARSLADQVVEATAVTIDGTAADWQGIAPILTAPSGGVQVNAAGIDLKALYAMMDEEYLYVLVEVYDPPITLQPVPIGGEMWEPQFLFNFMTNTNQTFHIRAYLPYHGQINLYDLNGPTKFIGTYFSINTGNVLEFKVPVGLIGNPTQMSACAFVMANDQGTEKVAKAFDACAKVPHPFPNIFIPVVRR